MSDHALSQEEIDALLRGEMAGDDIQAIDLEPAAALFQSILEQIAPVVSPVAGQPLEAGRVTVELVPWEELKDRFIRPLVARIELEGELEGMQLSVADGSTQQQLRALEEGDATTILNKIALAFAAGLEEKLGLSLKTEISSYEPLEQEAEGRIPWRAAQECAVFQLTLHGASGPLSWHEVLPKQLVVEMLERLTGASDGGEEAAAAAAPAVEGGVSGAPSEASASAPTAGAASRAPEAVGGPVPVTPAQFAPLGGGSAEEEPVGNIGLIMDVPLQVTVELGRKRMLVRDVLELGKGSLIELEKLAGEPVDVFVNGKLLAKGEVVVIDENFGVKVTSIVTPVERLQNLQ